MILVLVSFLIGLFSEPKDLLDFCLSLKEKCRRNLQADDPPLEANSFEVDSDDDDDVDDEKTHGKKD